jgi:3D (Asp-Asp-Asp) domain-containing protein
MDDKWLLAESVVIIILLIILNCFQLYLRQHHPDNEEYVVAYQSSMIVGIPRFEEESKPAKELNIFYLPTSVEKAQKEALNQTDNNLYIEEEKSQNKAYMGVYELTAYISTGNPCADGSYPTTGFTVASNDSRLWHKWIHIEGYGDYYVHDTGGMATNVLDVFVGSYDEAIQFGRRTAEVYIIE